MLRGNVLKRLSICYKASLLQVAFDPLDGSSIVGANFAVGAIFGIWDGPGLLGRTGAQQVAAAYAVYGPRTSVVLARPGDAYAIALIPAHHRALYCQ